MLKSYERDALVRAVAADVDAYLSEDAEPGTAEEDARVFRTLESCACLSAGFGVGRLPDAQEAEDENRNP